MELDLSLFPEGSLERNFITIKDFLNLNNKYNHFNLDVGINFSDIRDHSSKKILPSIYLAVPEDADEIASLFKEVYKGTYSYKELEDPNEIRKIIKDPNFNWIVFKNENRIIGCIAFHIDRANKSGKVQGLVVKEDYRDLTNISKLVKVCCYVILKKYEHQIFYWSCEIRTAHTKVQYMARISGLLPVAFLPKKDLFFRKEEGEFIYIIYNDKALNSLRSRKQPEIIFPILQNYIYAFSKYHIGLPKLVPNDTMQYNKEKLKTLKNNLKRKVIKDKLGNETYIFHFKKNDSYFEFFHNKLINNIEKTRYKASSNEELYIYLEELKKLIQSLDLRYFECFVSAYKSDHQIIFLEAGLEPMGYIPSYFFNDEELKFEDQIIFVYYVGGFSDNLKLLEETKEFIKTIRPLKFIKNHILQLGSKYSRLKLEEIAEECQEKEQYIKAILADMITKNEIDAKLFQSTDYVVFDTGLNNNILKGKEIF